MMAHSQYLFLIGAYRDNEVDDTHQLMLTLENLRQSGVNIKTITLAPLGLPHINQFVADTLNHSLETTLPLAHLLLTKTGGNPLFMGCLAR